MNKQTCEQIQEMLVDYSDGMLTAEQSIQIADHLAQCPTCRATLNALDCSLDLAKLLWQDNEAQLTKIKIPQPPRMRRFSYRRIAAIAAAALIIVGLGTVTIRKLVLQTETQPRKQLTIAQIETAMLRAGHAAQLLATADLIAKQPGGHQYAKERYTYLTRAYADLNTATIAKQRLKNISERSVLQ